MNLLKHIFSLNHPLSKVQNQDLAFKLFIRLLALSMIFIFFAMIWFLFYQSGPIYSRYGLSFITGRIWDSNAEIFGALPFIYGTLVTSLIALLIAVPISIAAAAFITELAPSFLRIPLSFLIEMLAAVPSVVYGLWGIFVLAPVLKNQVQPFLDDHFGFLPFFTGPHFGIGILAAGILLAIIILPTITSVIRETFQSIPQITREAALSLGATKFEMIWLAVIKTGVTGILSGVILGLGRAVGETMAVTMIIGNRAQISWSIFNPGATMSSVIANEYPEASSNLHLSALTSIGFLLFLISLLVHGVTYLISRRFRSRVF